MDRTVNRPSSVTSRPNTTINNNRPTGNFNNRPSGNSNIGNHGGSNNGGNRPSTGGRSNFGRDNARSSVGTPAVSGGVINNARPTDQYNRGNSRPSGNGNDRPGGNGRPGNDRPGGNMGGGNHGSNDRPGGNMGGGNHGGNNRPGGFDRPDNNRPGNRPGGYGRPDNDRRYHGDRPGGGYHGNRPGGRPHGGINHGGPRPDYNRYRWHSSFRPRGPRDRWYDYYRYNRWSWLYPIAPPVRPWRPRVIWYYRPIIPTGFRIYTSAPIITGVLGLEFGTLLDASLNYLYYNGYSIDGYQDNVVYLRDVNMLGYSWPDVMLQYNDRGGLCYAEFVTSSTYSDNYRFNNLYNSLCQTYGTPIDNGNGHFSWYGGDRTGFINLNFAFDNGRYYTVMTFGT